MSEEMRSDRVGEYLIPKVQEEFLFDELSDGYLGKTGLSDILSGVPVPIRKSGISQGMTTLDIARNMAYVIGCDINFKYKDNYISYIKRMFKKDFVLPLLNEGVDYADKDDYESACIIFRACIQIDPDNKDGFYCYGRACKDAYENSDDEDYLGRFKAESLEAFEHLTLMAGDFDMGFYFLGFGYLNMGLYIKAKLTWERFLELSKDNELSTEVEELLSKLHEPCKIEEGYNHVLGGRFAEGIEILEPYRDDPRFNKWWPLWYYLGVAYKDISEEIKAEEAFLKVLAISPSNVETMKELANLYKAIGNIEKENKYRQKIVLVENNMELDRQEKGELTSSMS